MWHSNFIKADGSSNLSHCHSYFVMTNLVGLSTVVQHPTPDLIPTVVEMQRFKTLPRVVVHCNFRASFALLSQMGIYITLPAAGLSWINLSACRWKCGRGCPPRSCRRGWPGGRKTAVLCIPALALSEQLTHDCLSCNCETRAYRGECWCIPHAVVCPFASSKLVSRYLLSPCRSA